MSLSINSGSNGTQLSSIKKDNNNLIDDSNFITLNIHQREGIVNETEKNIGLNNNQKDIQINSTKNFANKNIYYDNTKKDNTTSYALSDNLRYRLSLDNPNLKPKNPYQLNIDIFNNNKNNNLQNTNLITVLEKNNEFQGQNNDNLKKNKTKKKIFYIFIALLILFIFFLLIIISVSS